MTMIKHLISVSERFSAVFTLSSFFKIFQLISCSAKMIKLHGYSARYVHTERYKYLKAGIGVEGDCISRSISLLDFKNL